MSDVGLQVKEGIASGTSPYVDPAKRNIGLLMERERGVEGVPVKFVSQDEDTRIFGGEFPNTYGSFVVRTLFENAKDIPATIFGVRIVGTGSAAASLSKTISTRTVAIKAGRKGKEDKGTWGNNLKAILYSYNSKVRNAFAIEIFYKGRLVESFEAATCALLQGQINSVSDYITITFSGEIAYVAETATSGTGTWSTVNAYAVVGLGTAFTTELSIGDVLMANGIKVGKVKTITSNTVLALENTYDPAYPYAGFNYAGVPVSYIETVSTFAETFQLANGTYSAPVESDFYPTAPGAPVPKGLSCLDNSNVQLIAVTENHTLTMAQKLVEYCTGRADATAIINLPLNASDSVAELYANALQSTVKSYAAGYNVWVSVLDAAGNAVIIPGVGLVLGAGYLRTPFVQGDYAHIPPAGIDSIFLGVQECFPANVSQSRLNRLTRDFTVNSVVFKEGTGFYVATSRTYSTNKLFMSVHSNVLASYYIRYVDQNMDFVNQKPNTPDLRVSLKNSLRTFFKDQYDVGALEKELPFDEAVQIICDRSNNPLNGDRKQLNAEVKYIITETTEATTIALNRNDGILTTKVTES